MSTSDIKSAFAAQLGDAGSVVNTTLFYLDGGRLQFLAITIITTDGNRETISSVYGSGASLVAAAKQMADDYKAGTLKGA